MVKVIASFILGITVSACIASVDFPYHYYALDADSYNGALKGPTKSDDLLLKMCVPTEKDKAPCLVMFTSAFLRLKETHEKCQIDLAAIQRTCQ
jgi:hypothetical protein